MITELIIANLFVYPYVDYNYYLQHKDITNDIEISYALDNLLTQLDCTRTINGKQFISVKSAKYQILIRDYVYYIVKLVDDNRYNFYYNRLYYIHLDNLYFDEEFRRIETKPVKRNKTKYRRAVSKDLFDGTDVYYYENIKTKKVIKSHNPNLLNELNRKRHEVPLSAMTFNFKIK